MEVVREPPHWTLDLPHPPRRRFPFQVMSWSHVKTIQPSYKEVNVTEFFPVLDEDHLVFCRPRHIALLGGLMGVAGEGVAIVPIGRRRKSSHDHSPRS